MREILFRGKRKDNGEYVDGYLYVTQRGQYEISRYSKSYDCERYTSVVIPETVGQYTGLTDKNGTKIFECDIVKCKDNLEKDFEFCGYVDHFNGSFVIVEDFMTHYRWLDYDVEVIGNIYDNQELLKGGEE